MESSDNVSQDERPSRGAVALAQVITGARLTLTVEEAASLIGISRAQAYRCVKRGELKAVQLGRRIVVPVVALEQLLGTQIHLEPFPHASTR